jgi:hypothetical protein
MRVVIELQDRRGHQIADGELLCETHAKELLARIAPEARWPEPWEHQAKTLNPKRSHFTVVRVLRHDRDQPCDRCSDSGNATELSPQAATDAVEKAFQIAIDKAKIRADLEYAIAFGVQTLKGETPVELDGWPERARGDLRYATTGLINRFSRDSRRQAELRAREAVALAAEGRDYSILTPGAQNHINQIVRTALHAYEIAIEGASSPLASSRAAELSPEERRQS